MSQSDSKSGPIRRLVLAFRTGPQRRLRMRLASARRMKRGARFIAVTGSSGKSTTTTILGHLLEGSGKVRAQVLHNTVNPLIQTLLRVRRDDDFVLAELGVGGKGDMAPMANMFRPDLAIVTMIAVEHFSAFRSHEAVAEEKGALLEALLPDGVAVLNADDPLALAMAQRTRARVVTFGKDTKAQYRAENITSGYPRTLSLDIVWAGGRLCLTTRFLGDHFWMPVTAAVAAALELGVAPDLIQARLRDVEPVRNRCAPYRSAGGPSFILDAAKAPYGTLDLAFDMIGKADAPYKRIVLGTISDYAGSASHKYRTAYKTAREVVDQVIFVGGSATSARATAEDIAAGRFVWFASPKEAFDHIRASAREDELILLKGSSNLHLERIALGFRYPVRCWETTCGMGGDCFSCGAFENAFDRKTLKRAARRRRLKFWRRKTDTQKRVPLI